LALEVLAEQDLDIVETDRLRLTVHLALESVAGFHASAFCDPSDEELDEHFIDFNSSQRLPSSNAEGGMKLPATRLKITPRKSKLLKPASTC
jgi:hypothetical protein